MHAPLPARGWRSTGVNVAVVLAAVVFGLAAGEIGLRVAGWLAPPDAASSEPILVADPLLKFRGNPAFPEHDSRGFRNPVALDRADVVLLGDSMTHGVEVSPNETWGHVLATETGAAVYNMAISGWGPGQAAFVLPDALALKPKTVLYGFYFGNDLVDVLAVPPPPEARFGVETLPRGRGVDVLAVPPPPEASGRSRNPEAEVAVPCGETGASAAGGAGFVSRHSLVYGLVLDVFRTSAGPRAIRTTFQGARWRTVFSAPYYLCFQDRSDPRIRRGFQIVKAVLLGMARGVEDAGAAFAVALLPTKESVFAPRVTDLDAHEGLAALVAAESRLRDELTDVLRANGVPVIDLLSPLRGAPEQPYFVGADNHPNVTGHRAIGLAVAKFIRGMR